MPATSAIYTRISLDQRDDETGVARQVSACRAWAEKQGYSVSGVYTDNSVSASSGRLRPEFERLLRDKPERVIVWHLDRLLRHSSRDLERVLDAGFLVHSLHGGDFDLATSTGRALARTVVAWSQNEVELKGERQKEANTQRAADGRVYGRRVAYGWLDREGLEVDEAVAARIVAGVEAVLSGASLREIATRWNEDSRSPSGKPWTSVLVRQVLVRPMNAGVVVVEGEERRDISCRWKPLFDVETYDALRGVLASRRLSTGSAGVRAKKYLMGGLVTCEDCGATMHGTTARRQAPFYICSGDGCYRTINVETVDRFVYRWTALALLRVDPERFLSSAAVARLAELDKELADLRREREEAAGAALSVSSRVALLSALDARESALRGEAADLTRDSAMASLVRSLTLPDDTGDVDTDAAAVMDVVGQVEHRLARLSLRQQRLVVSTLGSFSVRGGRGPDRVLVDSPGGRGVLSTDT